MTRWDPLYLQGLTYTAKEDRQLNMVLGSEGVLTPSSFKASQRGAGANMSVDIAVGRALVVGDDVVDQGKYLIYGDAVENVVIGANSSGNPRIDIVSTKINDPAEGGAAGNTFTLTVTAGTPAASPVAPATPNSALIVAEIAVANGAGSITTANITDRRVISDLVGIGDVKPWPATTPPNGWLLCQGQAVSRTTYADLYALLGTTYGAGDGSTTFGVPDLRGRHPVGLDNMGGSDAGRLAVANTMGGTGGAETLSITTANMPAHTHTIDHNHASVSTTTDGTHTHSGVNGTMLNVESGGGPKYGGTTTTTGSSGSHSHTVDLPNFTGASGSAGSGTAINTMDPYLLMNWIIHALLG